MSSVEEARYVIERLEKGPHDLDERELKFIDPLSAARIKELQAKGEDPFKVWALYNMAVKESVVPYTSLYAERAEAKAKKEAEDAYKEWESTPTRDLHRTEIGEKLIQAKDRMSYRYQLQGMTKERADLEALRRTMFPAYISRTAAGAPMATVGADPVDAYQTKGMSDLEVLFEALKPQVIGTPSHKKKREDLGFFSKQLKQNLGQMTYLSMAREDEDAYRLMLAYSYKSLMERYNSIYKDKDVLETKMSSEELKKMGDIRRLGFTAKTDHTGQVRVTWPGMGTEQGGYQPGMKPLVTLPTTAKRSLGPVNEDLIQIAITDLSDNPTPENDEQILSTIFSNAAHNPNWTSAKSNWTVSKARSNSAVITQHLDYARGDFIKLGKEQIKADAELKGLEISAGELHKRAVAFGAELYKAYEQTLFPWIEERKHDPMLEEHGGVDLGPLGVYQIDYDTAYTLKHIGLTRDEQGRLVETLAMAGIRDVGGLIRLATDPMMEAISYDVDENGKPLDPEDWNYKMAMATNEALGDIAGGEGTFADYATAYAATVNPVTFARHTDPDSPRARQTSGNYLRDVAVSIARGRSLADDFNELGETTTVYANLGMEWVPTAAGFMVEVALPITPVPMVKAPIKGLGGATAWSIRKGANGMGHVAQMIDKSGLTKSYMRAMGSTAARPFEAVSSPLSWARQQVVYREALGSIRAAGEKPTYPKRVQIMDEAGSFVRGTETSRLPSALSIRVASDMAKGHLRGTLKTPEGSQLNMVHNLIVDADNLMVAAYKGGAKAWEALENSVIGRQIKDAHVAAATAGYKNGTPQIRHRILATIAEDALKQQWAHQIPNNWALVAGNVLVPVKAWKEHGRGVMKSARGLLKTTESAGGTVFEKGADVARMLTNILGQSKINATPYWAGIRSKLINNRPLTAQETISVNNFVIGGFLKEKMKGSVALDYAGEAFKRGARKGGKPSQLTKEIGVEEGIFSVAAEVIKGTVTRAITPFSAKPAKLKATGTAPVPIQQLMEAINLRLTRLDIEFRQHVGNARRNNREGFIDDLIAEFATDDVIGDLINILGSFFSTKSGTTWSKRVKGDGLYEVRKTLEANGFGDMPLTPDLLKRAIEVLRSKHAGLRTEGIKSRGLIGRGLEKMGRNTDQPDLALFAWMMDGYKNKVLDELLDPFMKENPGLLIRAGGDDIADMQSARAILQQSGIPQALVEPMLRVTYQGIGDASGLSPSDFRGIIRLVVADLFDNGSVAASSKTRIADAIMSRETRAKAMRVSRLRETARRIVETQMKKTLAPGAVLQPSFVNAAAEAYLKTYIESIVQASTDMTVDKLIGQLRAHGVSVPAKGSASWDMGVSLKPELIQLTKDISVLADKGAITSLEIKDAQSLIEASASAKLWDGLDRMRQADATLWAAAWNDIVGFIDMTRRTAVGGLLGGFPKPNGRYLGLNYVTAPFIAMVTTPAYVMTAFKTMLDPRTPVRIGLRTAQPVTDATLAALRAVFGKRDLPGTRFFNWAHASVAKGPDDVVMVDAWGRKWTKQRLRDSMDQHNIQYTQTTFEFRDKVFEDLRRIASTNPTLKKAGWMKQVWRYLNPANKNIWSTLAENTDLAFREAVYAEALRRGLTESQAAEVARAVLLDYGKVFPAERALAARAMLFYAFQREMMNQVVRTIVRDPFGMQAIRAQVVFTKMQHEESETWLFEPDYARSRAWSYFSEAKKDTHVDIVHYGPSLPALESFYAIITALGSTYDFYNMYSLSTNPPNPDDPGIRHGWEGMDANYPFNIFVDRFANLYKEKALATPGLDVMLDLWSVRGGMGEDVRTMDPRWILFFQNAGLWEDAQSWFNIRPSDTDPRQGKATYEGKEWVMDAGGYKAFRAVQYAMLVTGLERNIRDSMVYQMKTTTGYPDWQFKYLGEGEPVLYSVSLDTTMAVPDEYMVEAEIMKQIGRELDALE